MLPLHAYYLSLKMDCNILLAFQFQHLATASVLHKGRRIIHKSVAVGVYAYLVSIPMITIQASIGLLGGFNLDGKGHGVE